MCALQHEIQPKISVVMTAYNRESFIAQAIDSVLSQQTDFAMELIIGDDGSSDQTVTIIRRYAERYPYQIRLLLHPQHVGLMTNFMETYQLCRGEYVAFLDSDDYWSDPLKLRKQIDFLERHPDVVVCGHRTEILDQASGKIIGTHGPKALKPSYSIDDIFGEEGLFFHTSSAVYRHVLREFPVWFSQLNIENDLVFLVLSASYGKIGFLDETMAVYRYHLGGICNRQPRLTQLQFAEHCYMLMASHLDFLKRVSFRRSFSNIYRDMSIIHSMAGHPFRAMVAGLYAIDKAPFSIKHQVLRQVFVVVMQTHFSWNRICAPLLQLFRIIRIYGLTWLKRWYGERKYQQLKRTFHSMRQKMRH